MDVAELVIHVYIIGNEPPGADRGPGSDKCRRYGLAGQVSGVSTDPSALAT